MLGLKLCEVLKESGFNLKKDIRLIASGKIVASFDMVRVLAMGADLCNSARAMMMAMGCIQARECNQNTCPVGIATQNKSLVKGLKVKNGDYVVGVALLQMLEGRKLKMEVFPDKTAAQVNGFTENAKIYVR